MTPDGGPEWLHVCESGDQCIVNDWLCDKEEDCNDGSDERKRDCKGKHVILKDISHINSRYFKAIHCTIC